MSQSELLALLVDGLKNDLGQQKLTLQQISQMAKRVLDASNKASDEEDFFNILLEHSDELLKSPAMASVLNQADTDLPLKKVRSELSR